jgi:hypothetical protein
MAAHSGPDVITDGLVLSLDAGNSRSYPGSGTTWTDLSGNGNNGTLINGPTFDNSNGGSIVFDGVNDYVSVPNSSLLNPNTGSFSIIVWANSDPSSGGDGWDLWVAKRGSNSSNGYYLGTSTPGAKFVVGNTANVRTDTDFISYSFNTWSMFAGILNVQNNSQTVIRVSDFLTSSTTPAGGTYSNTNILSIGADFGQGQYYVNGRIAMVLIYNKALSNAELSQNFNSTRARFLL